MHASDTQNASVSLTSREVVTVDRAMMKPFPPNLSIRSIMIFTEDPVSTFLIIAKKKLVCGFNVRIHLVMLKYFFFQ